MADACTSPHSPTAGFVHEALIYRDETEFDAAMHAWPGRSHAEAVEALRHEALVNRALAGSGATVMSPFDAEHLDEDILAGVEMTHPTVVEGGQRRAGSSYTDPTSITFGELWPLEDPTGPVSEYPLEGSLMDLRRAIAGDPALGSPSAERRSDLVFAINEAASNAVTRQRDLPDPHPARRGRSRDSGQVAQPLHGLAQQARHLHL